MGRETDVEISFKIAATMSSISIIMHLANQLNERLDTKHSQMHEYHARNHTDTNNRHAQYIIHKNEQNKR